MADSRLGNSILRKLDSIEIQYDGNSWSDLHERIQEFESSDKFVSWYKVSFLSNVLGALIGVLAIGFQTMDVFLLENDLKKEAQHIEKSSTYNLVPSKDQTRTNKASGSEIQKVHDIAITDVQLDEGPAFPAFIRFPGINDEELMFRSLKKNTPVIEIATVHQPDSLAKIQGQRGMKRKPFNISIGVNMIQSSEMKAQPIWGATLRSTLIRSYPLSYFVQSDYYSGIAFAEKEEINSGSSVQFLTRKDVLKEISIQSIRIGIGLEYIIKSHQRFAVDISAGGSIDMVVSQNEKIRVKSLHFSSNQEPFETLTTVSSRKVAPYFIPGISSSLGLHYGRLSGRYGATLHLSDLRKSARSLILLETKLMIRLN